MFRCSLTNSEVDHRHELDTAVLGESGDSRPLGTCSRTGCLMSMISSTPCVGCWRYSPIYMPSECSKGPDRVDYAAGHSGGKSGEGFGIAVGGADVLLSPLPAAR